MIFRVSYTEMLKKDWFWEGFYDKNRVGQLIIKRVADYHALGSGACL